MFKRLLASAMMMGVLVMPATGFAQSSVENNRQAAVEVLKAFYAGDSAKINDLVDEVYIQHSNAADGRDALISVVEKGANEGWLNAEVAEKFNPRRVIADEEFAAVHYLDEGENKVYVDIFRFNENGKIGEHWDVAQEHIGPNKSGRTMLDGPATTSGASQEEMEANKAAVQRVYDEFFEGGNADMLGEVVHDLYIQHNPNGMDGLEFFAGLLDSVGGPFENTVHHIFAEGDMVVAHVEYPGWNLASVDIFRLKDGLIVEHWDVVSEIPAELPHDNGFF